ncbi:MAG: AsmA-like C-terminal region-containing protein [Terracidiphilus sp.]
MCVGGGLLAAIAVAAGIVALLLHRAEPFVRALILEELQTRFHARVELDSFHVSLTHGLRAEGKGLRIWPPAEVEGVTVPGTAGQDEPLIRLKEFRFHAPLRYAPGKPFHISLVELEGMDIHMPPFSHFSHALAGTAEVGQGKGVPSGAGVGRMRVDVETLDCSQAHLVLESSNPGKLPLEFAIAHFKLTNVASGNAMGFDAELTNPKPVGTIYSTGRFGPWLTEDPGETPITGDYRFEHADLATFKGIAGILTSTGHYEGTLRHLTVDGVANVPDFRLTHFGSALPLDTRFHARVDATNGDTWLEPVYATLAHSHFTAQGPIVRVIASEPGKPPHSVGHDIALTVDMDRGRIEDFLQLASPPHRTTPLLTGALTTKTRLHIPPGPVPVHWRLQLKGHFTLDQALFTSEKIQGRIRQLSLRGQGRPKEVKTTDPESIGSTMQGDFKMAGGTITLPNLVYTVPGATIELKGTYGMDGGTLDFTGKAMMEATVSQMVGGWAGALLKPADRFFEKGGAGTEVPIRIQGTREEPKFGLDFVQKKNGEAPQPEEQQ